MRTDLIKFKSLLLTLSIQLLFSSGLSLADQSFVDTKTGQAMKIDSGLFNTEQSKKFLSTGENPYNGNAQAIASGKKHYQTYSCAQCHGAQAQGQTAAGLTGPRYNHSKSATDKGMFEIIWAGTNGGMSGKGKGVMDPSNHSNGLSPDETLKVIAWIRGQGGTTK
ncbi:MAG: c-type cytochrome [Pseudomonadota bacterium]